MHISHKQPYENRYNTVSLVTIKGMFQAFTHTLLEPTVHDVVTSDCIPCEGYVGLYIRMYIVVCT